jgi:flagellar protein FlgJ
MMELTAANMAQWNANRVQLDLPRGDEGTRLKQMLDSMRDTLNKEDDLFNGGMGQDIFEDMLYEEYGRLIARTGGLGIADMIVKQYEADLGSTSVQQRAAALYDSV